METAKFETCPKCGCQSMKNIIYVKHGKEPVIYVQCAKCGSFVAGYVLKTYISDKTYETLLEIMHLESCTDSRDFTHKIEAFSKGIEEEYKRDLEIAKTGKEKRKAEKIIGENIK